MVGLFAGGVFRQPGGDPANGLQLLFLVVTTVIWFGSIDAAREVIKEESVLAREAAIGTRLSAYIASKCVVLFGLAAAQTLLLLAIVMAFQPLHAPAATYAQLVGLLILTSWVAVGLGLVVSALARSEDQATSFIPLVLIPQLLFAGSIVSVAQMAQPVKAVSYVVFSRWAFAGTGSAIDLNGRIAGDRSFSRANKYGLDFFALPTWHAALILTGFLVAFLAVLAGVLTRRLRR